MQHTHREVEEGFGWACLEVTDGEDDSSFFLPSCKYSCDLSANAHRANSRGGGVPPHSGAPPPPHTHTEPRERRRVSGREDAERL